MALPENGRHRGAHPQDRELFSGSCCAVLRQATADLSWLLSRGYAQTGSLQLVGDRYSLRERQRNAVRHCSCSDDNLERRRRSRTSLREARGGELVIDGFNLIITVEAALGGGVLVRGRDGCLRDLSGIHGTYRRVEETAPALRLAGRHLAAAGVSAVVWLLDQPVSNSGRLRELIESVGREEEWPWTVRLPLNADRVLKESSSLIATSDAAVLDAPGTRWVNLAAELLGAEVPGAWIVDLAP